MNDDVKLNFIIPLLSVSVMKKILVKTNSFR